MVQDDHVKYALVKIHGASRPFGNGFLGPNNRIVTCAHVVRDALDVKASLTRDRPTGVVTVEFHWNQGQPKMSARVLEGGWHPGPESSDIAILALESDPPAGSRPLYLARLARDQFPAQLQPFISETKRSIPIVGRVIGMDEFGRSILVANDDFSQFIESSVSGAAVFAQDGEVVEGIIVGRDTKVRQALVCPASVITAIFTELDAAAQGSSAQPTPFLEASSNTPAREEVTEDDVAAFLGTDPVRGEAVLSRLAAEGPEILNVLLDRAGGSRQVRIRLRKLCQKIGPTAIPMLLDAIGTGSLNKKLRAAPCFAAFFGSSAAHDGLERLLNSENADVQRLAVEAVGHIGYNDISTKLANLAKSDDYAPIGAVTTLRVAVVRALFQFFLQTGGNYLDYPLNILFDLEQYSFYDVLDDLTPAGGDILINFWLFTGSEINQDYALFGLQKLRMARSAGIVCKVLFESDAKDSVRTRAGSCLAAIGNKVAASELAKRLALQTNLARPAERGLLIAFSTLYAFDAPWPDCTNLIQQALVRAPIYDEPDVRQRMLMSLGRRCDRRYMPDVMAGLQSSDQFTRGTSALALAHLDGSEAASVLDQAVIEAGSDLERLFCLAAQIHAGSGSGDDLHIALQKFEEYEERIGAVGLGWSYLPPVWRDEVLAAFLKADGTPTRALLWGEICGDSPSRILAQARSSSKVDIR